jgi:hypothetical protein
MSPTYTADHGVISRLVFPSQRGVARSRNDESPASLCLGSSSFLHPRLFSGLEPNDDYRIRVKGDMVPISAAYAFPHRTPLISTGLAGVRWGILARDLLTVIVLVWVSFPVLRELRRLLTTDRPVLGGVLW